MIKRLQIIFIFLSASLVLSSRIPESQRKFKSPAVENFMKSVKSVIANPILSQMFENCFPDNLDRTVNYDEASKTTFVQAHDGQTMAFRQAALQVSPYIPLLKQDDRLRDMLYGVLKKYVQCILKDSYTVECNAQGSPGQRKYGADATAHMLRLSTKLYEQTNDRNIFTSDWLKAFGNILSLYENERRGERGSSYRHHQGSLNTIDTMLRSYGNPTRGGVGLVRSAWRPSEDTALLQYHIASNAMIKVELEKLAKILTHIGISPKDADRAKKLSEEIEAGIRRHAISKDVNGNFVIGAEVDGFGSLYQMDDAIIPNLVSLPYLEYIAKSDPLYQNTRKTALSADSNPYFASGKAGEGCGNVRQGRDAIWPIGMIMRAMTADNDDEIKNVLKMLIRTTGDQNVIHESFNKDDASKYSRPWFPMANALFGELIAHIYSNKRHILEDELR